MLFLVQLQVMQRLLFTCLLVVSSGLVTHVPSDLLSKSEKWQDIKSYKPKMSSSKLLEAPPDDTNQEASDEGSNVVLILFFCFIVILMFLCVFLYLYFFVRVEKLYISQREAQIAEAKKMDKTSSSIKISAVKDRDGYSQTYHPFMDSTENVRELKAFKSEFQPVSSVNRSKRPPPIAPLGKIVGSKIDIDAN